MRLLKPISTRFFREKKARQTRFFKRERLKAPDAKTNPARMPPPAHPFHKPTKSNSKHPQPKAKPSTVERMALIRPRPTPVKRFVARFVACGHERRTGPGVAPVRSGAVNRDFTKFRQYSSGSPKASGFLKG